MEKRVLAVLAALYCSFRLSDWGLFPLPVTPSSPPQVGDCREQWEGKVNVSRNVDFRRNAFSIVPMEGKTFGADVYGFDPALAFENEEMVAVVHQAVEKHLVLVFHNISDKLTPQMHVKLTKLLGPVDPTLSSAPSYLKKGVFNSPVGVKRALAAGAKVDEMVASMLDALEETAENIPREVTRIVKKPTDLVAFGEGSHTDLSYRVAPPLISFLVSRELPKAGGNTLFWDMRAAFDGLDSDLKTRLSSMFANHTDGHDIWAVHPVIRHDNKYGRESLFVNQAFTRNFVDTSEKDSQLLEMLFEYINGLSESSPEMSLDIRWNNGQAVMWDNRFTQHAAQNDYTERREMHRTVTSGTVPF